MPSLSMYQIAPPTDTAEFENISLDYLEHKYKADASLYGKKGQKQNGVDIIVTLKDNSYICAQCKDTKSISINNLDKCIDDIKEFKIPMQQFVIIVAIENDVHLQEYICKLTAERVKEGKVPVRLIFWNDIIHFVKKDQNMLRIYYPEFYHAEETILAEAVKSSEDKNTERIRSKGQLLNLFFDEAVKYQIEEFLNTSPVEGISIELIGNAEACTYSIKKLLFRSPMLSVEDNYFKIEEFLKCLDKYLDMLSNITESVNGVKMIARIKYDMAQEKKDIDNVEKLRQSALELYDEIKIY